MRKMIALIGLFVLAIVAYGCSKSSSDISSASNMPDLNEGEWEMVTEMDMPGMPSQTNKHTKCIKKGNAVPVPDQENNECTLVEQNVSGGEVSWTYRCKSEVGDMLSKGKIKYAGDTMDGKVELTMGERTWASKISGKRIGDCK
ncbi:MAG: DUF3617 family protein [Pseudomonadota bacterium]